MSLLLLRRETLVLSKIGKVKIKLHRPVEEIRRITLKCSPTVKWFVTMIVDVGEPSVSLKDDHLVDVDVGLSSFATLSNDVRWTTE